MVIASLMAELAPAWYRARLRSSGPAFRSAREWRMIRYPTEIAIEDRVPDGSRSGRR